MFWYCSNSHHHAALEHKNMHIIYTSLGWLNIPWSLSSSYIQCKISWGSAIWRKSLASKSMVGVSWLKRGIWHSKTNPKTLKVPWFSFQFWPMVSLWTISEAYLFVFGLGSSLSASRWGVLSPRRIISPSPFTESVWPFSLLGNRLRNTRRVSLIHLDVPSGS